MLFLGAATNFILFLFYFFFFLGGGGGDGRVLFRADPVYILQISTPTFFAIAFTCAKRQNDRGGEEEEREDLQMQLLSTFCACTLHYFVMYLLYYCLKFPVGRSQKVIYCKIILHCSHEKC